MLLRKLTDSFHVERPSPSDIDFIFKELDVNGDGKISQKEFDTLVIEVVNILGEKNKWLDELIWYILFCLLNI